MFCTLIVLNRGFRTNVFVISLSDNSLGFFSVSVAAAATFAIFAKGASAAPFVDTFGATIITMYVLILMPLPSLYFLRILIDFFIVLNIILMLFEWATQSSILNAPQLIYTSSGELVADYRPSGLFGYPLTAAAVLGQYSIALLVSTPLRYSPTSVIRLSLSILSLLALVMTGGRSSMLTTMLILALFYIISVIQSIASGLVNRAALVINMVLFSVILLALIPLLSFGVFDELVGRLENDYGSALSREFAWDILLTTPPRDLLFGLPLVDVAALQYNYNLIAIEISWINFILVCGMMFTIPLFVGFCLFLFKSIPKYCASGVYFLSCFSLIINSSNNGIWAKTNALTTGIALSFAFFRRDIIDSGTKHLYRHNPRFIAGAPKIGRPQRLTPGADSRTAAGEPTHHLLRIDRALAAAVAGKEGLV
jgi:hypothetical protein